MARSKKRPHKRHKRKPKSKNQLHIEAQLRQAKKRKAAAESELQETQDAMDRGLRYRIHGMCFTQWWLSTPEAHRRSQTPLEWRLSVYKCPRKVS